MQHVSYLELTNIREQKNLREHSLYHGNLCMFYVIENLFMNPEKYPSKTKKLKSFNILKEYLS